MRWMRVVWVAALSLGLGFPLAAAEEPAEQALKARADQLWEARVKGEWASVYEFLLPEEQPKLTREQFVAAKKEKGPVHYLSAEIGEVAVAGDTGWVEVTYLWRPSAYSAPPLLRPISGRSGRSGRTGAPCPKSCGSRCLAVLLMCARPRKRRR